MQPYDPKIVDIARKHLTELLKMFESDDEEKRPIGVVTLVVYQNGKLYPHMAGYMNSFVAHSVLSQFLGRHVEKILDDWAAQVRDWDGKRIVEDDKEARSILERGF